MDMRNYSHFHPQKPFSPVTVLQEIRFRQQFIWKTLIRMNASRDESDVEKKHVEETLFNCFGSKWLEQRAYSTDPGACCTFVLQTLFCVLRFALVLLRFGFHALELVCSHSNSLLHLSHGHFNWSVLCVFIRNISDSDWTLNWISKCDARAFVFVVAINFRGAQN